MKPMFIGQAPSRHHDEFSVPLGGRCGRFMVVIAGTSFEEMRRAATFVNVLNFWPGKNGKGDKFPMNVARHEAAKIKIETDVVVFVGKKVAEAFGTRNVPFLVWFDHGEKRAVVMPHPSGINVWYNDAGNRKAARTFLRKVLKNAKQR